MLIDTYHSSFQVTVQDLKVHNAHSFAWVPPFDPIFQRELQVVPLDNRDHGGFLYVQPVPSHDSAEQLAAPEYYQVPCSAVGQ